MKRKVFISLFSVIIIGSAILFGVYKNNQKYVKLLEEQTITQKPVSKEKFKDIIENSEK